MLLGWLSWIHNKTITGFVFVIKKTRATHRFCPAQGLLLSLIEDACQESIAKLKLDHGNFQEVDYHGEHFRNVSKYNVLFLNSKFNVGNQQDPRKQAK